MSSNLACIGLAVDDDSALNALVSAVLPRGVLVGRADGIDVVRWEDPSGARLVFALKDKRVIDFLPSLSSRPGARLASVRASNASVATAAVVDEDGEQLTSVAVELEQRQFLGRSADLNGPAAIIAFGRAVTVHESAEAFAAADDSLLDPDADRDAAPPPHYAERGWPWPPRVAAESFFSHGVFGDPDQAVATAQMAGVVSESARRVVVETGQSFGVARVRTAGFEADVCLDARTHPTVPSSGAIISGTVFLVASIEALEPGPESTRRRFSRRRR
ncbi:MAG: hypothetical protein JWL83_2670 [Actinomycetia bacterium]|nr:hypothetical protein [Actinomycetes bacterium]